MQQTVYCKLFMVALMFTVTGGCATQPTPTPTPTPPDPQLPATSYYITCKGELTDLEEVLAPIAANMQSQNIPYTQSPSDEWRDCSGNFLRLSSYLAMDCPETVEQLAAGPGVRDYRPGIDNVVSATVQYIDRASGDPQRVRDTRQIAEWYRTQGRFEPIYYDGGAAPSEVPEDLHKNRHLIRPGAVLWFSSRPPLRPQQPDDLDALFKKVPGGTYIGHMGIVTKVTRDASGQVTSFSMYHGRSTGKPGRVTDYHNWTPTRPHYPPFGVGSKYLVGIGTVVPVANPPAVGS
jgi:hypothetical protein